MQHLLLTKLAVGTPSTEWLHYRLQLFERFCAPSVLAQSEQRFRWVLAVGMNTPRWFIDRASAAARNATFVYQTVPSLAPKWSLLLQPIIAEGCCITTRCDSDDMLHRRFMQRVRETAGYLTRDEVIDFPVGLQLRLPDYAQTTARMSRPSHFISLVERAGFKRGVFDFFHNDADRHYPIRIGSMAPSWVEIAHAANISNSLPDKDVSSFITHHALAERMARGRL
jgi:hypothetical protein